MTNGARAKALVAASGRVLWLGLTGSACDPPTPDAGLASVDAGADRLILMAGSGGASCIGVSGAGGPAAGPPPGAGITASGGFACGAAGCGGCGARGGAPASASGGHDGTGGAPPTGGRGGVIASATGGVVGVASGGRAGAAGRAAGTGGTGGRGASGGARTVAATGGTSGSGGLWAMGGATGGAAVTSGAGGQGGTGGSGMIVPAPAAGDLAIVELLINPAGTDTGREWVEVENRAGHALDLASLHIAAAANDAAVDFTVSGTTVMLPGAHAVLIQSADPSKNGGVTLGIAGGILGGDFGTRVSLNNDGDTISVCAGACAAGQIIDQFAWDASLGADYDDHALSIDDGGRRCPAATPFGDAGSFGTAGTESPRCP